MKTSRRPRAYIFGKADGVCLMKDMLRAQRFIQEELDHRVIVQGVTSTTQTARGTTIQAPPVSNTNNFSATDIMPDRPVFRFSKRRGVLMWKEFAAFIEFVSEQIAVQIQSNDFIVESNESQFVHVDFKMDSTLL